MNIIDTLSRVSPYTGYSREDKNLPTQSQDQQVLNRTNPDELILNSNVAVGSKVVLGSIEQILSPNKSAFSPSKSTNNTDSGIFDFEAVADTVMSFISASMQNAKENGATDQELADMFEQAQAGVNLGIDQALDELNEYDLLDDSLREGIEKSRSLIADSIAELSKQLLPQFSKEDDDLSGNKISQSQNATFQNGIYASNENNADLSITTKDGDIVKITFSDTQQYGSYEGYQRSSNDEGTSERYQFSSASYRETNFSYTVEGELDDEERAAIGEVINQVNSIQKDFFNGNIESAYEKATQLGIDNEQLATYTLDLQQTQTSVVSQKYQEVAALGDEIVNKLDKDIKPLIDFLEQLKQLQDKASEVLSKNDDAFGQLLGAVYEAEFGNNDEQLTRFTDFIEQFDLQGNEQPNENVDNITG